MQDLEKNMSDSSQLIHSQILYQTTILTNKLTLFHIFVQSPLCIGFHIEYGTSAHKLPHWSCCKLGWLHFYTVVHQEAHLVPNGIQVHRCNRVWPFIPRPFGFIPGFQVHRRVIRQTVEWIFCSSINQSIEIKHSSENWQPVLSIVYIFTKERNFHCTVSAPESQKKTKWSKPSMFHVQACISFHHHLQA